MSAARGCGSTGLAAENALPPGYVLCASDRRNPRAHRVGVSCVACDASKRSRKGGREQRSAKPKGNWGRKAEDELHQQLISREGCEGWSFFDPPHKWHRQYQFAPPRRFRADFAFIDQRLLVEVDGQVHNIKAKHAIQCERDCIAAAHGWRVARVTPVMVRDGSALPLIQAALDWEAR